MTVPADTYISFGGDDLPDTEWLNAHARHCRETDDVLRAEALESMVAAFNEHARLSEDSTKVRAGSYRVFEFAVALEWSKAFRACAQSRDFPDPKNPSRSEVLREEISACMGNFISVTRYADELKHLAPLEKWTSTVPETAPEELAEFVRGYVHAFQGITEVPVFEDALNAHSRALGVLSRSEDTFEFDAGVAHATSVLCTAAMS